MIADRKLNASVVAADPTVDRRARLRRRNRLWRAAWLVALVLGVAVPRAYGLLTFRSTMLDSDEAIIGLMARHILDGHLQIFYYGQYYLGSIEAIWTAVLFAIFDATPLVLKLGALSWFCAFLPVQYFLTREVAGPFTARLTTLLLGASPAFLTVFSLKAFGYMSVLFLGTLALLLATRMLRNGHSPWLAALLGIVMGIGWWTHFLTIATSFPIAVILAAQFRQRLFSRTGIALVGGFIFGSFPFWLVNIVRSWASFGLRPPQPVGFWTGLRRFFDPGVPVLLGMRPEGGGALDFFPFATAVALLVFAAALIIPSRLHVAESKNRSALNGRLLLITMLAVFPFLFAVSGFGGASNPRFLVPLYACIYPLLLLGFSRPVQLVLASLLLVINLNGSFRITRDDMATALNPEPNDQLIAFLRERHIRTAYAPYWIAYRLTFESQEEIICTPPLNDLVRYHPYLETVRADPAAAYIQLDPVKHAAVFTPVKPPSGYSLTRVGNFEVYLPPSAR